MGETSFIHITDLHVGNPAIADDHLFSDTSATLGTMLELIASMDQPPKFIIASGDLSNRGYADSYRHLKAIMAAKKKPTTTVSLADLGLDAATVGQAGSGTTVFEFTPPPPKSGGEKFEDDGSGADKIVQFLVSRNLV